MNGVAETIREQLGSMALMMMGAKNLAKGTDKDGREYLSFRIGKNSKKVNYIKITLNPLDFYDIDLDNVPINFIDFFELSHQCKFRACTHINEPKCKVKEEVEKGNILPSRYENYKMIYDEIKNQKPKY